MKRPRVPPMQRQRALTDRQDAYLEAIERLTAELGSAPTAADVARQLGVSRKGVAKPLRALLRKGYLTDVPVVIRAGWALTEKAAERKR